MRAEGYRVRALVAGLLLIFAGCAGSAGSPAASPAPAGASSAAAGSGSPTGAAEPSGLGASPATGPSAEAPATIALSGDGPIGMAIDGTTGWVVATDSGHLIELDLAGGRETAAMEIGPNGTHVVAGDGGRVFVGRFATGGRGDHLVVVAPDHTVGGIKTGALGGLARGEGGVIWALEKAGSVLRIDPLAGKVSARVAVTVDPNTHMELVAGAGARWVASDATPVRRIAADATVVATIETGGGIPLAFADGLVWGARADQLWAIDPAGDAVTIRVPLSGLIEILALDVAADGTEAWIAARKAGRIGTVVRVALPSGTVLAEHAVALPAAVEIGDDRAWVTDYETDTVLAFAR